MPIVKFLAYYEVFQISIVYSDFCRIWCIFQGLDDHYHLLVMNVIVTLDRKRNLLKNAAKYHLLSIYDFWKNTVFVVLLELSVSIYFSFSFIWFLVFYFSIFIYFGLRQKKYDVILHVIVIYITGKSYMSQLHVTQSCNTKKIIRDSEVGDSMTTTYWSYEKYMTLSRLAIVCTQTMFWSI